MSFFFFFFFFDGYYFFWGGMGWVLLGLVLEFDEWSYLNF
jgi:hypothetical protein